MNDTYKDLDWQWSDSKFKPREAYAWRRLGFDRPGEALAWRAAGFWPDRATQALRSAGFGTRGASDLVCAAYANLEGRSVSESPWYALDAAHRGLADVLVGVFGDDTAGGFEAVAWVCYVGRSSRRRA